jgi:Zn finger protein HypA/HybF involved in hydrogenase expression
MIHEPFGDALCPHTQDIHGLNRYDGWESHTMTSAITGLESLDQQPWSPVIEDESIYNGSVIGEDAAVDPIDVPPWSTVFQSGTGGSEAYDFQEHGLDHRPLVDVDADDPCHNVQWPSLKFRPNDSNPFDSPSFPTASLSGLQSDIVSSELHCTHPGCHALFTGTYRKGNLARHMRSKHATGDNELFRCQYERCERCFQRQDAREKHYRKHHPRFRRPANERRAKRSFCANTETQGATSSQCDQTVGSPIIEFDLLNYQDARYEHPCLEKEVSLVHTNSSINSAPPSLPHQYQGVFEVDTRCSGSSSYDTDERVSNGKKDFTCPTCHSTFQRSADMRRHMHKHGDTMRPCVVLGCECKFYRQDKLRDHVRHVHMPREEVPVIVQPSSFPCARCNLQFRTQGLLRNHYNRKHNLRYKCDACAIAFGLMKDLERHRSTIHKRLFALETFQCPNKDCATPSKLFDRKDNFLRHVSRCKKMSERLASDTSMPDSEKETDALRDVV